MEFKHFVIAIFFRDYRHTATPSRTVHIVTPLTILTRAIGLEVCKMWRERNQKKLDKRTHFEFHFCIRGLHIYKSIWAPFIGEIVVVIWSILTMVHLLCSESKHTETSLAAIQHVVSDSSLYSAGYGYVHTHAYVAAMQHTLQCTAHTHAHHNTNFSWRKVSR